MVDVTGLLLVWPSSGWSPGNCGRRLFFEFVNNMCIPHKTGSHETATGPTRSACKTSLQPACMTLTEAASETREDPVSNDDTAGGGCAQPRAVGRIVVSKH
ncbi:hypothetical protein PUN4_280274 [Paraburkholderia unamae]|nr:hypothetical protein PUN4_280274 [Paraburkholderia unamae]